MVLLIWNHESPFFWFVTQYFRILYKEKYLQSHGRNASPCKRKIRALPFWYEQSIKRLNIKQHFKNPRLTVFRVAYAPSRLIYYFECIVVFCCFFFLTYRQLIIKIESLALTFFFKGVHKTISFRPVDPIKTFKRSLVENYSNRTKYTCIFLITVCGRYFNLEKNVSTNISFRIVQEKLIIS